MRNCLHIVACLLLAVPVLLPAQDNQDSLYWAQDSTLQMLLDTVDETTVRKTVRQKIASAVDFAESGRHIVEDSIEFWKQAMRRAVILEDRQGMNSVDKLLEVLQTGDRGHLQFYLTYMTMWAQFVYETKSLSPGQKLNYVADRLDTPLRYGSVFYEDRLADLGSVYFSELVQYLRDHLVPRMSQLDQEMTSVEDLRFLSTYDRIVEITRIAMEESGDESTIRPLLEEKDPHLQRFARDVLMIR